MKYKIKYDYSTGSSFGSHNAEGFLENDWENLDIATENLNAIQSHYTKVYQRIRGSYSAQKHNEDVFEQVKDEWWFVSKKKPYSIQFDQVIDADKVKKFEANGGVEWRYDQLASSQCIKLKLDSGELWQLWCPWCGYFESLYGCEIVAEQTNLKFEI